MTNKSYVFVTLTISFFGSVNEAWSVQCKTPDISKENLIKIIQQERLARKDLPTEIPNAIIDVRRQRCHYIYSESSPVELKSHNFSVNQYGVIVNVSIPHTVFSMNCPSVELSKEALSAHLKQIRIQEPDIPREPQSYTVDLNKIGCYFMYEEDYDNPMYFQLFTFDFNGELVDFLYSISQRSLHKAQQNAGDSCPDHPDSASCVRATASGLRWLMSLTKVAMLIMLVFLLLQYVRKPNPRRETNIK